MNDGSDFKARARAVRETVDLVELITADGVELRREGALFKGLCPFHRETTASFAVYADGGYKCHGCGVWGDAITYVCERQNLSRLQALTLLEGGSTPKLTTPRASTGAEKRRRYQPRMPIPDVAMTIKPTFEAWIQFARARLMPTATWWYQSQGGTPLMVDARYEYPHPEKPGTTKKEVRTWCWARDDEDGSEHWCQTRPPNNVPLYGLEQLIDRPADLVVVCEGAKKAEAIKRWSPHVGMAWCGGCEAVSKADWSPLKGRRVSIWPDHDKVGAAAAAEVHQHLIEAGAEVVSVVDGRDPYGNDGLPEGFDAADCSNGHELNTLLNHTCLPTAENFSALIAAYPGDPPKKRRKNPDKSGEAAEAPPAEPPPTDTAPTPPGDGHDPDLERSDIANATAFVNQHHNRVRYCAEIQRWHVWDGVRWAAADADKNSNVPGAVMVLAEQTALSLASAHMDLAKALRTEATDLNAQAAKPDQSESAKAAALNKASAKRKQAKAEESRAEAIQKRRVMQDMVALASSRPEIVIQAAQLDAHDYFLNTPSGTIDLRDGRVYEHDPKHLITKCCGVAYDAAATSTALLTVVDHVTNHDADVAQYVQDILGHSIFGHNDHEQVFLWWGPGGSGKGTLMEAIKSALGDYAMKAEFQSFVKTPGARVRDDLDRLKEARVVLASEVDHGEEIAAAVLKEMSGGDTIASRQLYGTYKEFRPRMTLHLQANDRPRVDDRDSGIWRRMVCIPCGPTVPADRRDPGLKSALRDPNGGAKAVLAWLVAGAIRTHAAKFIPMPAAVTEATRHYRQSNNPLADFLRERTRIAAVDDQRENTWCTSDAMHQELKKYYDLANIQSRSRMSPKRFRERLDDWGIRYQRVKRDHVNTQHYIGITLAVYETSDGRIETNSRLPSSEEHEKTLAILESGGFQVSTFPHGPVNPSHAHAHAGITHRPLSNDVETWKDGKQETDTAPPDLSDPQFDPDQGALP